MRPRRLLLVAPTSHRRVLAPLIEAYSAHRVRLAHAWYDKDVPAESQLADRAGGYDAVLLTGSRRRAPRTVLSAPVLAAGDGRLIPAGWLPLTDTASLQRFADTVSRVHARRRQQASLALLAQRHPRYLRLATRMQEILGDRPVFRWTSDALLADAMIDGLSSGLGSAIYFGHGRPIGWVGYYGLRAHHFDGFDGEPLGALLSLCCDTASRRRTGLSFAEALPLRGVCAATFAAVDATLHLDNTRWAVRLSQAMLNGATRLGELIHAALPVNPEQWRSYRIIGDPLCPLLAPAQGSRRAQAVEVHA